MTMLADTSPITDITVSQDKAGFPVVSWTELRGSGSGPHGRIAVECRIMKDSKSGVLMFVATGPVRHGKFVEGFPWEALGSFSIETAEELYYSKSEASRRQHLATKGLAARWLWGDPGRVLVAQFGGGITMHLNHVDASKVDLEHLHRVLDDQFVLRAKNLVGNLCKRAYWWPQSDDKVQTFDADASLPAGAHATGLLDRAGAILSNTVMAGLTAGLVAMLGYIGYGLLRPWLD